LHVTRFVFDGEKEHQPVCFSRPLRFLPKYSAQHRHRFGTVHVFPKIADGNNPASVQVVPGKIIEQALDCFYADISESALTLRPDASNRLEWVPGALLWCDCWSWACGSHGKCIGGV